MNTFGHVVLLLLLLLVSAGGGISFFAYGMDDEAHGGWRMGVAAAISAGAIAAGIWSMFQWAH